MVMMYAAGLVSMAVLGWLAGMLTFKRSLRWCSACGAGLKCPQCSRAGLHDLSLPRR